MPPAALKLRKPTGLTGPMGASIYFWQPFRRTPTANARGGRIRSEGGVGEGLGVRRVLSGHPSDRCGSSAFAVGMLRDIFKKSMTVGWYRRYLGSMPTANAEGPCRSEGTPRARDVSHPEDLSDACPFPFSIPAPRLFAGLSFFFSAVGMRRKVARKVDRRRRGCV